MLSYEFDAYKFYNTTDKFDIDREQLKPIDDTVSDINGPRNRSFYFRWNSIFDKKNKTLTVDFPGSACLNSIETYKSYGSGYKLIKKLRVITSIKYQI
jgi:hypothetical protein